MKTTEMVKNDPKTITEQPATHFASFFSDTNYESNFLIHRYETKSTQDDFHSTD